MEITLPHAHSRADVRARLRDRTADIASFVPGGMANVDTSWSGEDRMDMVITAMGQTVSGGIDIADDHVTITVDLPSKLLA